MISHQKKFIFFHMHRTGGTSIDKALMPYCEKYKKHQMAKSVRVRFPKIFKPYFKFSIVRNPWDQLVSLYCMQKRPKNPNFILPEKYVISRTAGDMWLFTTWVCENNNLLVDYVGRFENLNNSWKQICEKINIPYKELGWVNKSGRQKDYRKHYTKSAIEITKEKYKGIAKRFGYEF